MACSPSSVQCNLSYLRRGDPTPDCCRDNVIATFAAATKLFDEAGIHWWLDYGALLGAVREGGIIAWDNDADIGILARDYGKLKKLRPAAAEARFQLRFIKHVDYARAQVSFSNKLHVCIFVWHPLEGDESMLTRKRYMRTDDTHGKGKDFPKAWIEERSRVSWEGIPAWAPADPHQMLEHRYGDWRSPVKHHQQ